MTTELEQEQKRVLASGILRTVISHRSSKQSHKQNVPQTSRKNSVALEQIRELQRIDIAEQLNHKVIA